MALQQTGDVVERPLVRLDPVQRTFAGHGLDAAHARGDACLVRDLEDADVARAVDVRAAAELDREVAEVQHAHLVAVLLAEQRHGTRLHGVVVAHQLRVGRHVAADLAVDDALDLGKLLRSHGLVVREVEAQPVRRDERAFLLHVLAEHLPERGVHQVRSGVIEPDRLAALGVNVCLDRIAHLELAGLNGSIVHVRIAARLRIDHRKRVVAR